MESMQKKLRGLLLCILISIPCWYLGKMFPLIGGPVFAIIAGMIITIFIKDKSNVHRMTVDEYESGEFEPCQICLPNE